MLIRCNVQNRVWHWRELVPNGCIEFMRKRKRGRLFKKSIWLHLYPVNELRPTHVKLRKCVVCPDLTSSCIHTLRHQGNCDVFPYAEHFNCCRPSAALAKRCVLLTYLNLKHLERNTYKLITTQSLMYISNLASD